ncbi:helix-turn-helix domain-containing protein [Austwickia chelonae]|uniref:helix-turn-helix domain-containing protein n=1 Tax=Austwickia chelonae TaxID=100225 RepID=UPI000E22A51A|nr:helix-turn-helix transcriptional regulator [Austwickia chelonae]
MILLRREMGDALRECRTSQGRTLRDISSAASVSLGYLSEIERGEKEASSELLAAICAALSLPMSQLLIRVAERAEVAERSSAPVALPLPRESNLRASAA